MILSRDEVGKLWWNDVNFFTNEYDSAIGLRLVNNSSNLNRNTNSHSPDNTTSGELPIYPRNRNTQMEWSCSCLRFWKIDLEKLNGIDKWYEKLLSKLKRIDKEKKEALVKVLIQRIEETKTLLQKRYEESGVMYIKNGKKTSAQTVLDCLKINPRQTKLELENATGLSRATITRALSELARDGKIKRIGVNKNSWWEIM